MLTGEVGTGKTTLCRNLLSDLPENVDVALILNANINEAELLQTLCDELKIDYQQTDSQKQLLDKINHHLLSTFAANRHTVLIIDEAQLLSRDVLEQIRLLTNLETTKSKLLQIILIGQPELNDLLSRNDLRQLAQRVTARYHLGALERGEIEDYVNYRLGVAGCKQPLFSRQALNKMHMLTGGIPRKINVLADHSLLSAYAQTQSMVESKTVKRAAKDVFITTEKTNLPKFTFDKRWAAVIPLFLILNLGLWAYSHFSSSPQSLDSQVVIDSSTNTGASTENQPAASTVLAKPASVSPILESSAIDIQKPNTGRVPGTVTIADAPLDASIETQIGDQSAASAEPITSAIGLRLEASSDLTGRIAAFRRLAEQWGVELPQKLLSPACTALAAQGIQCLGVDSWAQALSYNRPTIMVLSHQGQLHRVILQKVVGDTATIQIGSQNEEISVAELNRRWTKNAITFWRPGDAGSAFLQLDDRSTALPDLRKHINQALVKSNLPLLRSQESVEFDLDLSQKIFALQSRFNILADSQVGSQTYLLLNEIVQAEQTPILYSRLGR